MSGVERIGFSETSMRVYWKDDTKEFFIILLAKMPELTLIVLKQKQLETVMKKVEELKKKGYRETQNMNTIVTMFTR